MISEWKYVSVGVENVDQRNRAVINKLVASFRRVSNEVAAEQRNHILDMLITDIFFHFEGESVVMQETAYPEFQQHDRDHKLYTEQAVDLYKQLRQGMITPWEMLSHLFDGLCHHIVRFDSRYADYLRLRDGSRLGTTASEATNAFD